MFRARYLVAGRRVMAMGLMTPSRYCGSSSSPSPPPPPPNANQDKKTEKGSPKSESASVDSGSNRSAPLRANSGDCGPLPPPPPPPAQGNSAKDGGRAAGTDINDTFSRNKNIPRGFEAFYANSLAGKMLPRRSPTDAVARAYTMSPEERVVVLEMVRRARRVRRWRQLAVVMCIFAGVVAYRQLVVATALSNADISGYKAIIVNLADHVAVFVNEKGKLIGMQNFIDFYAFEKMCDPERDILIEFPSYYPWMPMMVLCMLPILALINASFNSATRLGAAMMQAEKSRFSFQREFAVRTRLRDVAGLTEAKHEVVEVIDFLKNPARYESLGAKLPKGVLLDGPPGVGKTLLAKAISGEAMVPFISCSGSEFEEVYVGVGAQRVRELFREAHKCKPCVVFIDEIDAFGCKRKSDGNSSSRGTLNAFLSELDGFKDSSGIMVLAATNRSDILDNALTRSGRFDRKISLEKPAYKDRIEIAKVHLAPLHLDPCASVQSYAETVAALTPGCSGADIFNVCNEAAIQAAREGKDHVGTSHFHIAVERVLVGLEKSAVKYTPNERERIAYHEAGVVVLNWFLKETDPVIKSTILPRGRHRTGVTQMLPQNTYISTQECLIERIVGRLGGYVAEEHFFCDVSTSAANQLQSATNMARQMVCTYGMDPEHIGHFGYELDRDDTLQKPFGPDKEDAVDASVEHIVQECLRRARQLLSEHLHHIRVIAGLLLRQETLLAQEMWFVLGDRPVMSKEFQTYLES